ncbi:6-hydroxymethylpterin diphosphokinase MptE-like protein [Roseivirga sp.]|uniref:6-hydroxymethylpterin diphosphokinase MptE-like protein n=1 Tax=Roseivirga sp. TaxID=1964215 RepID=UPI003B8E9B1B
MSLSFRGIKPKMSLVGGDQWKLAKMKNKYSDKSRCFLVANGPSLNNYDLSFLKDEISIGCNGVYKSFDRLGFRTNYLIIEDTSQFEIRASELEQVKDTIKMTALYNSYAIKKPSDWIFFHSPRSRNREYYFYSNSFPQFSRDFAAVAHLGSTVTYIMIQWAYHLGFEKVYLLGLDHNYGKLCELFPPGRLEVTKENYHLVQQCHFDKDYWKIGDRIGVPKLDIMERAYSLANEVFNAEGKEIVNLNLDSGLSVFRKMDIEDLDI